MMIYIPYSLLNSNKAIMTKSFEKTLPRFEKALPRAWRAVRGPVYFQRVGEHLLLFKECTNKLSNTFRRYGKQ